MPIKNPTIMPMIGPGSSPVNTKAFTGYHDPEKSPGFVMECMKNRIRLILFSVRDPLPTIATPGHAFQSL